MIGILPILALHVEVTVRHGIRYLNRRFQVGGPQVSSSLGLLNLKVCMFKLPTRTLPAHHWQLLRVPVIMPCSVDDAAPGLRLGPGVRVPVVTAEGRWPGVATSSQGGNRSGLGLWKRTKVLNGSGLRSVRKRTKVPSRAESASQGGP